MAPNSRPPLTSRIRASFEGKRTKPDILSPPHNATFSTAFSSQDPEALRSVIEEAINSEAFQNAIAANLANLIKPSIKTALDTIQPIIETVCSHDMLLMKTNRSVENILERMDTNAEAGRPMSMTDPLRGHPFIKETPPTGEDAPAEAVEERAIVPTPAPVLSASPSFEELRQALNESNAATAAMKGQLDQLKTDLDTVMGSIGADIGKNVQELSEKLGAQDTSALASHTEKLDAISADLEVLKEKADLSEKIEALAVEVGVAKAVVEAGNTSNGEGFTNVLTAIEGHTGTLAEIKDAPPHPDILAALQQSNDAHAIHTATLAEIKEKSLGGASAGELAAPAEGGSPDNSAALAEIKADLASIKENIEAGLAATDENITGVGAKVDIVLTTIEGHKTTDPSAEILAAVQQSNESHATHTAALEEIKTANAAHTAALESHGTALEDIKSLGGTPAGDTPAAADNSALETQLGSIIETLGTHTSTLNEMKAAHTSHIAALDEIKATSGANAAALEETKALIGTSSPAPAAEGGNLAALEAQTTAMIATLDAHTAALDEIKVTGGSHTAVLDELKTSQATHTGTLDEIKATTTSHGMLLDEIKAAPRTAVVAADSGEASGGPLSTVIETLESHTKLLDEIKEDVSAEILTALHDLGQSQAQHIEMLTEIREADLSDEVLTLLHSSSDSHAINTATLGKIMEAHAGHAAALEEIKTRSVEQTPGVEGTKVDMGELEEKIGSITSVLEEHKSTLAEIKEVTKASHDMHVSQTASLDEIKSKSIEPSAAVEMPNLGGLEEKIGGITSKLEEHDATLASIQDIMQASHDLHTAHTASLDEIKSRSVESGPAPLVEMPDLAGLEEKIVGIASTLLGHNASLATIKEATAASNDSHAAHTASLDELKSRLLESAATSGPLDLGALDGKISGIASKLEEHDSSLSAIKDAATLSNESHAAHTIILGQIKEVTIAHASHTIALGELKTAQPSSGTLETPDISSLETHLNSIISTLEMQNGTLAEIKDSTSNPEILTTIKGSHDLLTSHTSLLETIKDASSHADILENISALKSIVEESKADLNQLHTNTTEIHANLATSIAALAVGAGTAALVSKERDGDNSSKEILEEVKAVRAIVEETKGNITTMGSQLEINHTTITTSISTLNEELKAEIDATGTDIRDAITIPDLESKPLDLTPITASIERCSTEIKAISSQLETLDGSLKEHGAQITTLHQGVQEGIHLNEKGISQLKEHSVSTTPIAEGAWMRSSRSVSRQFSAEPTPEPVVSQESIESKAEEADASPEPTLLSPVDESAEPESPSEPEPIVPPVEPVAIEETEPEPSYPETEPAESVTIVNDEQETIPPSQSPTLQPTSTIGEEEETIPEPSKAHSSHELETKTGTESKAISKEESPEIVSEQPGDTIAEPTFKDTPIHKTEILAKSPKSFDHEKEAHAEGASTFDSIDSQQPKEEDVSVPTEDVSAPEEPVSAEGDIVDPAVVESENPNRVISEEHEQHQHDVGQDEREAVEKIGGEGELKGGESLNEPVEPAVEEPSPETTVIDEKEIERESKEEEPVVSNTKGKESIEEPIKENTRPELLAEEPEVHPEEISEPAPEPIEENVPADIPVIENDTAAPNSEEISGAAPEPIEESVPAEIPVIENDTAHLNNEGEIHSPIPTPEDNEPIPTVQLEDQHTSTLHDISSHLDASPSGMDTPQTSRSPLLAPTIAPSTIEDWQSTTEGYRQSSGTYPPSTQADWQSTTEEYGYPQSSVQYPPSVQDFDIERHATPVNAPGAEDGHLLSDGTVVTAHNDGDDDAVVHANDEFEVMNMGEGLSDEERHHRERTIIASYEREIEPVSPRGEEERELGLGISPFMEDPDEDGARREMPVMRERLEEDDYGGFGGETPMRSSPGMGYEAQHGLEYPQPPSNFPQTPPESIPQFQHPQYDTSLASPDCPNDQQTSPTALNPFADASQVETSDIEHEQPPFIPNFTQHLQQEIERETTSPENPEYEPNSPISPDFPQPKGKEISAADSIPTEEARETGYPFPDPSGLTPLNLNVNTDADENVHPRDASGVTPLSPVSPGFDSEAGGTPSDLASPMSGTFSEGSGTGRGKKRGKKGKK